MTSRDLSTIFEKLYGYRPLVGHDFRVGDRVRIGKVKKLFSRVYLPNGSKQVFEIFKCFSKSPPIFFLQDGPSVAKFAEHSASDRRARVRGSPGETLPCTLMAPGACKIRCECNVLQVAIQNNTSRGTKERRPYPPSPRGESKLRWHITGSSFGMNPRPSAIAH